MYLPLCRYEHVHIYDRFYQKVENGKLLTRRDECRTRTFGRFTSNFQSIESFPHTRRFFSSDGRLKRYGRSAAVRGVHLRNQRIIVGRNSISCLSSVRIELNTSFCFSFYLAFLRLCLRPPSVFVICEPQKNEPITNKQELPLDLVVQIWWFYIDILQHPYHDSRLLSFLVHHRSRFLLLSSLLRFEHVVVFSIHWLAACISTCSFTAAALFTFL